MVKLSYEGIDVSCNDFTAHDLSLLTNPLHKTEVCLLKLQQSLDELKAPRLGVMKGFDVAIVTPGTAGAYHRLNVDLCEVIEQYKIFFDVKIYFHQKHIVDPSQKNVNPLVSIENSSVGAVRGVAASSTSLKKDRQDRTPRDYLQLQLRRSAEDGGDIVSNNGHLQKSSAGLRVAQMGCQCHRMSRANFNTWVPSLRTSSYNNDRSNNRAGKLGKNGKKRSSSLLPTKKEECCPFRFTIYQDSYGFYVQPKNCHVYHEGHPRRDNISTSVKNLLESDVEIITDTGKAHAKAGVGKNLHYVRTKRRNLNNTAMLDNRQVIYLCKHLDRRLKSTDGNGNDTSDTDDLYALLQKKKFAYVSLLHKVKTKACSNNDPNNDPDNTLLFSETVTPDGFSKVDEFVDKIQTDNSTIAEAKEFANQHRDARSLSDKQDMMLSIAYASPFQISR